MLKQVKIENFKSVKKVDTSVGRFNVIIGENGAGKSNFLEALAVYSAIEAEKFDNEFLSTRGIRYPDHKCLFSLFDENIEDIGIQVEDTSLNISQKAVIKQSLNNNEKPIVNIEILTKKHPTKTNKNTQQKFTVSIELPEHLEKPFERFELETNFNLQNFFDFLSTVSDEDKKDILEQMSKSIKKSNEVLLKDFIIYSPENSALRKLEEEGTIRPLGINGEGLFSLLQKIKNENELDESNENIYKNSFRDIIECASKFDWVDSIEFSDSTNPLDHKITITDQYLISELDQRSANEGFLFVLFYATLFCSNSTPKIFAIDNIDASLNPRMCKVLIEVLIEFSKKYDKQVFVTTHNPAILDGLNLYDDEQALFVVNRNSEGHTKFKRLNRNNLPNEILDKTEGLRLSEAFIRGYLGGLPKNF